ncbi:23S rRNA (adenine(1618)-N(6))-methyltransferase RlmF [Bizionia sp. KMM 8389]
MHPNSIHHNSYDFPSLIAANEALETYVVNGISNELTIDFSDAKAVYELNKAILMANYDLTAYELPNGYLCPPIPGRADYIHHIQDLLDTDSKSVNGLDIGVGANAIYAILGAQIYNWKMIGADINSESVKIAKQHIIANNQLKERIDIRLQENPAFLFKNIIQSDEWYDFSMCNPPFHASEVAANKGTSRKLKNLNLNTQSPLNFGGQSHELWCNGGEALFLKRMIKESKTFAEQVGWFTSLVSKGDNLPKLIKQLDKMKATHKIIPMSQGQKKSRILAWHF